MKKWQKAVLGIVGVILVAALGVLAMVTRSEAHGLVTHPMEERDPIDETPADYGLPYEEVTVTNADGLKLVGWYVPSQNGATIIAQHGYKSDRTGMLPPAEVLHRHGYGVLITTVRAHDLNEGEQIGFGAREMQDLEAWYQYLRSRDGVQADKIGILGESMGGSLVLQYAAQNQNLKAVAADCAFSSLDDTVSTSIQHFTGLPPFPFVPMIVFWAEQELGFDTSDINAKLWVGEISPRAVFLLQGGADDYVSPRSGELLYEAAGEPKQLWYEPDLGHTDFWEEMPEQYEQRVVGFFDQYLLGG